MITQDLAVQDPSNNTRSAREHKIHQTAQGLVSLDPSINAIIKPVCIQDDTNEKECCPSSVCTMKRPRASRMHSMPAVVPPAVCWIIPQES